MPYADLEIAADEGAIQAHAAWPDGDGPFPAVLVLSDSRGPTEGLKALVRRLGEEGFFAVAPDLFRRLGSGQPWALGQAAQAESFDAWLDYLAHEHLADDERIGVAGYGVGGALALQLAAAHGERVSAVASFYGGGPGALAARELAARLNAVVHLGYPADDLWLLAPIIAEFEKALSHAGVDFESEFYPARHGFAIEGGEAYDPRAARLHWLRLLELFRRTLAPLRGAPTASVDSVIHAGA